MINFLEFTVDKFTFKIADDRYYSSEGLWAKPEENLIRIGLSDFLQQRSGDVAFADIRPEGTELAAGDEIATIETIKVNISLSTPLKCRVVETNPAMEISPETINQDPYGAGWLAVIQAANWEEDKAGLMEPQSYFAAIKGQAEEEAGKS